MLTYLITVTEGLICAGILVALLYVFVSKLFGQTGTRIMRGGIIGGLVLGLIMAILKNKTKRIDTGMWNLRIIYVSLAALLIFLVFLAVSRRSKRRWPGIVCAWAGAIVALTWIFYVTPDVYAYPFNFNIVNSSVISTDFLFRLIGYLAGLALIWLVMLSLMHTAKHHSARLLGFVTIAVLLVNAVWQVFSCLQKLYTRHLIPANPTLFKYVIKPSYNSGDVFIYLTIALAAVIPVWLAVRSLHVNEPYSNPAQHRKIRAKWRSHRRWAALAVICLICVILNMTVITDLNNREVTLSPAEDALIKDDGVYVSLDQVSDGHLHRFAYTTEDGIDVRFIVIKKPNSSNYGVGLDACDICGETGYYERGGQVICSLCDVVMNIRTIGFKGGCNPIVIDYRVDNGYIIVPIESLVEYKDEFK